MTPKPTISVCTLVVLAGSLGACTGPQVPSARTTARPQPSTAVGIADFKSVAGVWDGILHGLPSPRSRYDGDWIMLRIGDDGSYEFASFREIGVFRGSGTLRLSEGRLFLEGPRGRATLTLYADDGRRLLRADGVSDDGLKLTAELTPKTAAP